MKTVRLLCGVAAVVLVTTVGCGTAQPQAPSYHLATTVTSVSESWVKVSTVSGEADNVGEPFTLEGDRVRLAYTLITKGTSAHPAFSVYVMEVGKYLDRDGGTPVLADTSDAGGSGETITIMPPGTYYLDVAAAGWTWEITVYEWR